MGQIGRGLDDVKEGVVAKAMARKWWIAGIVAAFILGAVFL